MSKRTCINNEEDARVVVKTSLIWDASSVSAKGQFIPWPPNLPGNWRLDDIHTQPISGDRLKFFAVWRKVANPDEADYVHT